MQLVLLQRKHITMSTAPLKTRIYAFLLDYLVIVIYGLFVVGTTSLVFRPFITPLFSNSPVTAEMTGFLMMTLPVSLYFIICERSRWQGTWGKKKMAIRVVDRTGKRIGLGRSTVRTSIKLLPWEVAHFGIWRLMLPTDFTENAIIVILTAVNLLALTYLLSPLTNKKRKTIYDWIAGTEVVG
ncbi:RDD family protein [Alkalihalobacillus sp. AL-G]|uniref:RDD family protein n=1 Tax=Alkalihalobacillus sp. AL-G TaxID=2926399 RepID=UPI002729E9FA|nr:RDD family protein [Alkalihalobacillus sp. AL-G]WLD94344.1 RDD family protein [Alkalihalobacillus sp. AL-G]